MKNNNPQFLIIHHSASLRDQTSYADVNGWHKSRNFPKSEIGSYVGYHYLILGDGTLHRARNDHEMGAHAKDDGMNYKSIGICLTGDFELELPSEAQLRTLKDMLLSLTLLYGIKSENVFAHSKVSETLCCGKNLRPVIPKLLEKKLRHELKSDEVFSALVLVDAELSLKDVKDRVYECQKLIWESSQNLLGFEPLVVPIQLMDWSDESIKELVRDKFELEDYQAVCVIYKKGKFRGSYGNMNPNDKDFGVLINVSFEDPDGEGQYSMSTVLTHELMHAFFYLIGEEYIKYVHETPNEFEDDFVEIGRNINKLYYGRDLVNDDDNKTMPEETKLPVEDVVVKPKKKFWLSSANEQDLSRSVKGLLTALVPMSILVSRFYGVEVTGVELNELVDSVLKVIAGVFGVSAGVQTVYGLGRKLVYKFKK